MSKLSRIFTRKISLNWLQVFTGLWPDLKSIGLICLALPGYISSPLFCNLAAIQLTQWWTSWFQSERSSCHGFEYGQRQYIYGIKKVWLKGAFVSKCLSNFVQEDLKHHGSKCFNDSILQSQKFKLHLSFLSSSFCFYKFS